MKEKLKCESCGAEAEPKDRGRFNRRHPKLCTARKEFAKQLAQTTRAVDDEENRWK